MENTIGTKISNDVIRKDNDFWHYYFKASEFIKEIPGGYQLHFDNKELKLTGKYLFFSVDKDALEKIVINEIESDDFLHAKINTDKHKKGKEYVLCLYYHDDSKKFELADKYKDDPNVKYRYWKSDEDTLKGKYSNQFLETLSPEERKKWTRSKV